MQLENNTPPARNVALGEAAMKKLQGEVDASAYAQVRYHQLEITDNESIAALRDHLKQQHDGLDVLVNNAGVYMVGSREVARSFLLAQEDEPIAEQVEDVCKINYFGLRYVCEGLFALVRDGGR